MRLSTILFLCLFLAPLTAKAQADTPIGEFVAVKGGVFIVNDSEEVSVEKGDPVFMDDVVETDGNARALIMFKDETELVLGGNVSLEIDTYVFDPANTANNEGNFTIEGPFAWVSGLLPKENKNVEINTTLGSIGIRGTTVWGGPLDDKFGVFVFDGKVHFTNSTGRVSIENGEGVFVDEKNAGLTVKTWGQPKIDAAINTVAFPAGSVLTEKYNTAFTVKPKKEPPPKPSFNDGDEIDLNPKETIPEVLEEPSMEEKE